MASVANGLMALHRRLDYEQETLKNPLHRCTTLLASYPDPALLHLTACCVRRGTARRTSTSAVGAAADPSWSLCSGRRYACGELVFTTGAVNAVACPCDRQCCLDGDVATLRPLVWHRPRASASQWALQYIA
mmetsp:Transcript_34627/g.90666  ORF Transcript_34627/g.90666 Transcript_34627/m.90666 type:complete len:132 (+) Transcript_34627:228-623(+)